MGELFNLTDRPEFKAALIQELTDIDIQLEPLQRRAEQIRRELGLLDEEDDDELDYEPTWREVEGQGLTTKKQSVFRDLVLIAIENTKATEGPEDVS